MTQRQADAHTPGMGFRRFGACVVLAAVLSSAAAASSPGVPQFSLSAAAADPGAEVDVRVERVAGLPRRAIRLYLARGDIAQTVRSRLDSRLSFIGFVGALRQARTTFTVPPLQAGTYALAYWCRGCLPRGKALGIGAAPKLRVNALGGEACPITTPNGRRPPGGRALDVWTYHGNGALAALLPQTVFSSQTRLEGSSSPGSHARVSACASASSIGTTRVQLPRV